MLKESERIFEIPISKVFVGDVNVRRLRNTADFGKSIKQLKQQILSERKVTTPLEVLPADKRGRYEIVAGSRRFTAMSQLYKEGKKWARTLPCTIRDLTPQEARRHSMIENLQRNNLQPYEEGVFYEQQLLLYPNEYPSLKSLAKSLGIPEKRVLTLRSLTVLSPSVGETIRTHVSTSKDRKRQRLLPLSHGIELAKLFSRSKIKARFASHDQMFRVQRRLANKIYHMSIGNVRSYLNAYGKEARIGAKRQRIVIGAKIKAERAKSKPKLKLATVSVSILITKKELRKLHSVAHAKGLSDRAAVRYAVRRLIGESDKQARQAL
jgi:ParB/RepB/Spo0J family partition protein